MKICFVAPADSYHIAKWCKWFHSRGHEVHVVSFTSSVIDGVTVHSLNVDVNVHGSDISKLKYFKYSGEVKRIVEQLNPDIINVHYATSYGTAVALSGLKGYVLSVWGADIYDFPNKSILHKAMLKFSLSHAKYIFSTSNVMAEETQKYTKKKIEITPFGVDTELFLPVKQNRDQSDDEFVVGTVKALTPKYGIEYLLKAVAIIKNEYAQIPIKLRIAGKGNHEDEYKNLAVSLGIDDITTWLGFISQEQAAKEWANMDVGIIASTLDSESFGVSAVEAQACGIPVIISDVPGLMEATSPGQTSVVVPRKDEKALAKAIVHLYENSNMRTEYGRAGRTLVLKKYEINNCFENIEKLFLQIVGCA